MIVSIKETYAPRYTRTMHFFNWSRPPINYVTQKKNSWKVDAFPISVSDRG